MDNVKIGDIVNWSGNSPCVGIVIRACFGHRYCWFLMTDSNFDNAIKVLTKDMRTGGPYSSCNEGYLNYASKSETENFIKLMREKHKFDVTNLEYIKPFRFKAKINLNI